MKIRAVVILVGLAISFALPGQQLLERWIVLPRRQFPSFKPICQLLVSHESLFGFVSPDAD